MSTTIDTQVAQMYVAMFGRAPDSEGLAYWSDLLGRGLTTTQVADAMFATSPARTYFPSGLSNQQIIASFYVNVLGRMADGEGLAYWTNKLDALGATPGSVINEMIGVIANYKGTDPAGLASAALFDNRSAAAEYYGEHGGSTTNATQVLAGVTADLATVTAARTLHLPAVASGTFDAGGYATISFGTINGDLNLVNLIDGATLDVYGSQLSYSLGGDPIPEWTINCTAAGSASNASLTVLLDSVQPLVVGKLAFAGVQHVTLANAQAPTIDPDIVQFLDFVPSLSLAGSADMHVAGVVATSVDATGMTHNYALAGSNVATFTGSANRDTVTLVSATGAIDAGAGDDYISLVAGAVKGGPGADFFSPLFGSTATSFMTVTDFQPGIDAIGLGNLMRPAYSVNGSNIGSWHSAAIALSAGATFNAYLDAAASLKTASTPSIVSWFNWGGDTYIVVDNDLGSEFLSGTDQVVKLTGLFNLSLLHYGVSDSMVPAVLR